MPNERILRDPEIFGSGVTKSNDTETWYEPTFGEIDGGPSGVTDRPDLANRKANDTLPDVAIENAQALREIARILRDPISNAKDLAAIGEILRNIGHEIP